MKESIVKEQYVALVEFLTTNKDKKVSKILKEFTSLCCYKNAVATVKRDDNRKITHIHCYYHKEWEDITTHEYGNKASNTTTGLNTMCKEGVRHWTKQYADYKRGKEKLLHDIAAKPELATSIASKLEELETARNVIVPSTV